jgi:hypothetical protein
MPKARRTEEADPLPLLLEATRRALAEHLARQPFCAPEIEGEIAGMWGDVTYARSKALREQIKYRGRGSLGARL